MQFAGAAAMPGEQEQSVVQAAMETLQETHGSSHRAILGNDGADQAIQLKPSPINGS